MSSSPPLSRPDQEICTAIHRSQASAGKYDETLRASEATLRNELTAVENRRNTERKWAKAQNETIRALKADSDNLLTLSGLKIPDVNENVTAINTPKAGLEDALRNADNASSELANAIKAVQAHRKQRNQTILAGCTVLLVLGIVLVFLVNRVVQEDRAASAAKSTREARSTISAERATAAVFESSTTIAMRSTRAARATATTTAWPDYVKDAEPGSLLHVFEGMDDASATSLAWSPDGEILASVWSDGVIRLWQVSNGSLFREWDGWGANLAYSPDGKTIASGYNTILLWSASSGALMDEMGRDSTHFRDLVFSSDGQFLYSASGTRIVGWDVTLGEVDSKSDVYADGYSCAIFSPDGMMIALGTNDKSIWVETIPNVAIRQKIEGYECGVVAFSPNGKILANAPRLYEISDGALIGELEGHTMDITSLSFSPNSEILATGSNDFSIRFWDVAKQETILVLEGHTSPISALAYSPDGSILASSGSFDNTIRLWRAPDGQ